MKGFETSMDGFLMFATNKTFDMNKPFFGSKTIVVFLALVCLLWSPLFAQQSDNTPLEEQMTPTERRATGINKLTPQELEALNAWLADREIGVANQSASQAPEEPTDRRGFRERIAEAFSNEGNDDGVITSRIVGTFDGWEGETSFELENGMVWRQTETSLYTVRPVNNPEVVIRRGLFDRWRLQVKGYNKRVTVERVK